MEKQNKLPPPPSGSSSSFPPQTLEESSQRFRHDVSQMPDFSPGNRGHRRAQSEIPSLPGYPSFNADFGVLDQNDEMEEDVLAIYLDMDKIGSSSGSEVVGVENLGVQDGGVGGESSGSVQNEMLGVRHQHSQSMNSSTSTATELLGSGLGGPSSPAEARKRNSAAKLADLALVDPKRAKRMCANRQSAARSRERQRCYIAQLERKLQAQLTKQAALQTEETALRAMLQRQRNTTDRTAENSELELPLQTMEQQAHPEGALNDASRGEVGQLNLATGQMMPNAPMMNLATGQMMPNAPMMNLGTRQMMPNVPMMRSYGANQQFYHNNHNQAMQSLLAARRLQQLQTRHQHQQQQPPSVADLGVRGTVAPPNPWESSAYNANNPPTE